MLVRELINVLKNFPRKHIFTLLIGLILIISISLLGNIKFTEENQYSELIKSLSLSSLTDGYEIDIPPIVTPSGNPDAYTDNFSELGRYDKQQGEITIDLFVPADSFYNESDLVTPSLNADGAIETGVVVPSLVIDVNHVWPPSWSSFAN